MSLPSIIKVCIRHDEGNVIIRLPTVSDYPFNLGSPAVSIVNYPSVTDLMCDDPDDTHGYIGWIFRKISQMSFEGVAPKNLLEIPLTDTNGNIKFKDGTYVTINFLSTGEYSYTIDPALLARYPISYVEPEYKIQ